MVALCILPCYALRHLARNPSLQRTAVFREQAHAPPSRRSVAVTALPFSTTAVCEPNDCCCDGYSKILLTFGPREIHRPGYPRGQCSARPLDCSAFPRPARPRAEGQRDVPATGLARHPAAWFGKPAAQADHAHAASGGWLVPFCRIADFLPFPQWERRRRKEIAGNVAEHCRR